MSGTWGKNIRLSIFGESRGQAVGIVVDGLPPGLGIDMEEIRAQMRRRAPGGKGVSGRREADEVAILSGVYKGNTAGSPIAALIYNTDAEGGGGEGARIARPSHADYTGFVKYAGFNDMRGGGHFSGRLTAPLVFAGALCKAFLADGGVQVTARTASVAGKADFDTAYLEELKRRGDSAGGVVECVASGVPAGWGDPFFDSLESVISSLLFAIPGVKGVEFGAGRELAGMLGSQANDQFLPGGGTATNNSGGINGGISNGMPVVVRAAFRPTPSIAMRQQGLVLGANIPAALEIEGRHDPCIAVRAAAVVEACVAIALADRALEARHG